MTMPPKSYPVVCRKNVEIHRAGWIVVDPFTIVENGYIEIENNSIARVGQGRPVAGHTDHGPGVLMPGLINAHLHLELSALKSQVSFDLGFEKWVQTLLTKREALSTTDLVNAGRESVQKLFALGHRYVGDVSTLGLGDQILSDCRLKGISFQEYLGAMVDVAHPKKHNFLSFSVAGHAPHTTSPPLLKAIKKAADRARLPFSIHVAESKDESEFIEKKKGSWADFLTQRGIDFSSWDIGSKTPVSYLNDIGILGPATLAVHLINVTPDDVRLIADTRTKVVLCPRSNMNLHKKLPDIDLFMQHKISPALGTDSLASCDSLNILDEMNYARDCWPHLPAESIFSMGTINGAAALGLSHRAGTIHPGKDATLMYKDLNAATKNRLIERIITDD